MSEIDLIPQDYRQLQRLRQGVLWLGIGALVALVLVAGSKAALAYGIRAQQRQIERMQAIEAAAIDQQTRIDRLRGEQEVLESRLTLLSSLRGGVAAREMLVAVDRALDGDVWFLDWSFRRAGELVENRPEVADTGYFLVVPQASEGEPERAWLMQTHMEIRAQAYDHAVLAGFVRRLIEQPEIEDVRILNTRVRPSEQVVDFELAIVVRSGS